MSRMTRTPTPWNNRSWRNVEMFFPLPPSPRSAMLRRSLAAACATIRKLRPPPLVGGGSSSPQPRVGSKGWRARPRSTSAKSLPGTSLACRRYLGMACTSSNSHRHGHARRRSLAAARPAHSPASAARAGVPGREAHPRKACLARPLLAAATSAWLARQATHTNTSTLVHTFGPHYRATRSAVLAALARIGG